MVDNEFKEAGMAAGTVERMFEVCDETEEPFTLFAARAPALADVDEPAAALDDDEDELEDAVVVLFVLGICV